ncbi:hypothetical protein LSAT2_005400 [Lamellibrachia satsuma]|nr:hypothetical protein LSAT2_005400 [Lamellibrachia satsuma]
MGSSCVTVEGDYGQSATPFLLAAVKCQGTEGTLISCPHSPLGTYTCDQAAGVECQGESDTDDTEARATLTTLKERATLTTQKARATLTTLKARATLTTLRRGRHR